MARFTLSQTWSVGPVCLTISAVGDPAPERWAERMGPIVEAVEHALSAYETEEMPLMWKATTEGDEDE